MAGIGLSLSLGVVSFVLRSESVDEALDDNVLGDRREDDTFEDI